MSNFKLFLKIFTTIHRIITVYVVKIKQVFFCPALSYQTNFNNYFYLSESYLFINQSALVIFLYFYLHSTFF